MSVVRFGILGARPECVSLLGRRAIELLRASGAELVAWVEGDAEPALPWNLHQPGAMHDATVIPRGLTDNIDFLLLLGDFRPAQPVLDHARHGVWRFATPNPAPLAFWDVFDGLFHIEVRLDRLTVDPKRSISLDRRWVKVDRQSYRRTLNTVIQEMAEMPAYAARNDMATNSPAIAFPPAQTLSPSALDLLRLRAMLLSRSAGDQYRGLFFSEAWQVGVVEDSISRFVETDSLPRVRWLPSPDRTRFLADPFVASTPGGWLLMAEEFDFATGLGKIVQEFSSEGLFAGRMQDVGLQDEDGTHVSYPFLLSHGGALYCIPETHQKNGVWAWRWNETSRAWQDPREIVTGVACIDPTPVFFENRWWLFYTDKADGVDSKLRICFADSPFGPWRQHARNPVKTDIRSSRPGGTPFMHRGQLYRPAQDSSKHYGWRLVVNLVTRLSPDEFEEEPVRILDSSRLGANGIHTLSGAGSKTVLDARRWRFTPWLTPRRMIHKFRKLYQLCKKGS